MKPFIYLFLFFVGLGEIVSAQDTKPLEVRFLEFSMPLGEEWYQAQRNAWKQELMKNKKNEAAWENYAFASQAMYAEKGNHVGTFVYRIDSLAEFEWQKEQRIILKEMKKHIPDTRTYYQFLLKQTEDKEEKEKIQQKIVSLKRQTESDFIYDMDYYHHKKQLDKIKEVARQWYESGLYAQNFLTYCYNELSGLKENAVLVSDLNLGTYYRYLLQYGMGIFSEVEVVDALDLKSLADKEKRPVYYTQIMRNRNILEEIKDSLYNEGLVFRYSTRPYNNLAAMRKNYEQNYLLDYLRQPLYKNNSRYSYIFNFLTNYIVSFSPLLQFYDASGDKNQARRLRSMLQGILDCKDSKIDIEDTDYGKYFTLFESISAFLQEQKEKQKDSSIRISSSKDQYQKLIDPLQP